MFYLERLSLLPGVEKVSDHNENKLDNCRNLDKGRNSELKFYPIERMLSVLHE